MGSSSPKHSEQARGTHDGTRPGRRGSLTTATGEAGQRGTSPVGQACEASLTYSEQARGTHDDTRPGPGGSLTTPTGGAGRGAPFLVGQAGGASPTDPSGLSGTLEWTRPGRRGSLMETVDSMGEAGQRGTFPRRTAGRASLVASAVGVRAPCGCLGQYLQREPPHWITGLVQLRQT